MIKEWCEKCEGRKGIYVQDDKYPTLAKLINCPNCNGLGYTELEPVHTDIESAFARMIGLFDIDNDRAVEVYIKESKSE